MSSPVRISSPRPTLWPIILLFPFLTYADATAQGRTSGYGPKAERYKVAFYNVETLFDTVRNPLIDDGEFTPKGMRGWNTARYRTKIENLVRVIDDMRADILGIAEVENEAVVRDLLLASRSDYNYIHINTSDRRGMDVALLYRGDKFFPTKHYQWGGVGVSREFLVVWGELAGERMCVIVCHMPSQINSPETRKKAFTALRDHVASILARDPAAKILVLGDFNDIPSGALIQSLTGGAVKEFGGRPMLLNPFTEMSRAGYGSYVYRDRRLMYDNILFSGALSGGEALAYSGVCSIFVRDYMVERHGPQRGYPLRTFSGRAYKGGFSDHLPVYIYLENKPR